MSKQQQQEAILVQHPTEPWGLVIKVQRTGSDPELTQAERLILALRAQVESLQSALHAVESGAKVELMRRDNLIDSLQGLCESYRTQVERLEAGPRIGKCQACGHECEACHLQNASQTPQTGLSLVAAPQEWSPAYTRGQARQSAPVAAVPALVPMHSEAVGELAEKYAYRDFTNDYPQTIDDLVRDVEAHHGIGLTVGDGGAEE